MLLVNDRELMGDYVNGLWANIAGVTVTILLIIAGIGFGLATVFPKWLGG
jgi:Mn2+/Fe2+ NRAMP family transporter